MDLIAHRGSSGRAPENTLAALRAALEDRADAVEIDVQATRDGELMLLHDLSLKRTTGDGRRLVDLESAEAGRLDAGSWFGAAFGGERIPTLGQALSCLGGRVPLHVEVKASGDRVALARDLLRTLDGHAHGRRTFISSADWRFLAALRGARPALKTGLVLGWRLPRRLPPGLSALSVPRERCTPRLLARARSRGMRVLAYTVNDQRTCERLRKLGVAGVFTDVPARLRGQA